VAFQEIFRDACYELAVHLLVIEDDLRVSRVLARLLSDDRHVVEVAATGADGLDLAEATSGLDAILLDVGLPDVTGFEVARRLRARGSGVPILMLTARDAVEDRVQGLDAGADDYVVKPFAYAELAARLRALARRTSDGARRRTPVLRAGPIALDETRREVTVDERRVDLSQREFALLECLLRHPDQVLTRDQLLDHAWPMGVAVTHNSVDAYVSFVRRKLGRAGERLETVRGVGYRLSSG
jgi:DNA-binding response OmpR family regulator